MDIKEIELFWISENVEYAEKQKTAIKEIYQWLQEQRT